MLMHSALTVDKSTPSPIPADVRELLAAQRAALVAKAAPDTWAGMDVEARWILVMLTDAGRIGDPMNTSRKAWGAFTDAERSQMATLARRLLKNLAGAAYL